MLWFFSPNLCRENKDERDKEEWELAGGQKEETKTSFVYAVYPDLSCMQYTPIYIY